MENFVEAKYGIQFIHRVLAYVILGAVMFLFYTKQKFALNRVESQAINIVSITTILQVALGIFTIIFFVPIELALLHQVGAFFLLMSVIYSLFIFKKN